MNYQRLITNLVMKVRAWKFKLWSGRGGSQGQESCQLNISNLTLKIFAVKNYIAGNAPKLTKLPLFILDIKKHLNPSPILWSRQEKVPKIDLFINFFLILFCSLYNSYYLIQCEYAKTSCIIVLIITA